MLNAKYPILLLHGFGATGETFKNLHLDLENAGYKVYAPNLYHQTPFPTLYEQVETVIAYLKTHQLTQIILCGHSLGGKVALALAIWHPEYIKNLMLFSPGGFHPLEKLQRLADFAPFTALIGSPFFFWCVKVSGLRFVFKKRETITLLQNWCGKFKDWDIHRLGLVGRGKEIPKVDLLLWGEKDTVLGFFTRKHAQKVLNPAQYIEIPKGNHNFFRKQHRQTSQVVLAFLNNVKQQ